LIIVASGILLLSLTPYPHAFAAVMRQAKAHRSDRQYSAVLADYQRASHLDPESPLPWLRRGEVLLTQHRFSQATDAFHEAARRGAGLPALLNLGESYAGRGDWTAAMETWLRARALAPYDARPYVALGRGSIAQRRFEQAARLLTWALELQPAAGEATTAHTLLGRLQIADDPAQAADHFRQANDADMLTLLDTVYAEPDLARRALLLGAAFLQRDELPLARRYLERAVARDPAHAEAHAYLGHVLDRMGATVAARSALEQAIDLDPESALAHYFLGLHHRQVGSPERAQDALWEALLRDPENAAMRVAMAETFVDLGDYPHAEEWYRGAVDVASEGQRVAFQLLLVHFYLDHLYQVQERGMSAAEAAVALAPDDARTHDLLGWAGYLTGRLAEAEQALIQSLSLDPDLVSAHYHLGALYVTTSQQDLARQRLQRAVDLDTTGYYRARAEQLLDELD
jgi:tetratricopeptide (TPR) repeat protein